MLFRILALSLLVTKVVSCTVTGPQTAESLVADLDAEIRTIVERGNSPSIQVAVVFGNQIIWSEAFGKDTSVDHVYMSASVQKSITAAAVLLLLEEGLVGLDTDVQQYVPFTVRHPEFSEKPVTLRMLLAHRSGLDAFPNQFAWDTKSAFSPEYRPPCPDHLLAMDLEEFLSVSFRPDGSNYDPQAWIKEPGAGYHYSVSTYPFLRYLVGHVSGQSYPEYVRDNIFIPLGMSNSGFGIDEFVGRHAIPFTRIDGNNVELPEWEGNGWMMRTSATDMAKFVLLMMNNGHYRDVQVLPKTTVELMQNRTSRFKVLFKGSDDLPQRGHGLGNFLFRGGWFGNGGSAPGYQILLRYNPSRKVGYVIMSNVNAILGGGANYESARREIYNVQDALISILDPTYFIRSRLAEYGIMGGFAMYFLSVGLWIRKKRAKKRVATVT